LVGVSFQSTQESLVFGKSSRWTYFPEFLLLLRLPQREMRTNRGENFQKSHPLPLPLPVNSDCPKAQHPLTTKTRRKTLSKEALKLFSVKRRRPLPSPLPPSQAHVQFPRAPALCSVQVEIEGRICGRGREITPKKSQLLSSEETTKEPQSPGRQGTVLHKGQIRVCNSPGDGHDPRSD